MTIKLKGSTDGSVSLTAPADTSPTGTDITLTLPTDAGSANQFLKNSGTAGTLDYSSMVETSTGVGIGTSNPDKLLHVVSSGNTRTKVSTTSASSFGQMYFGDQDKYVIGYRESHATQPRQLSFKNTHSSGTITFRAGGDQERMRIDSSGRLLINHNADTAPASYSSKLQLCDTSYEGSSLLLRRDQNNGSAPTLLFAKTRSTSKGGSTVVQNGDLCGQIIWFAGDGTDANSQVAYMQAAVDGTPGSNDMPGRLGFFTTADGASASTERMRIGSDGYHRLFASSSVFVAMSAQSAGTTYSLIDGNSSATSIGSGNGSNVFRVYTNGNTENTNNSFGAISDAKLKENIVDASSQWDDIKDIRIRKYNFIEGQTHTQLGVVAQEVETVSPGLVTDHPDRDDEGNDLGTVTKSVNYSVLYMKAVKALQEAMDRIETLETKVAALEAA